MTTKILRPWPLSLLAILLTLAGCGDRGSSVSDDAEVAEADRYGGTAVIGAIGDIVDINPLTSTDHTSNQVEQFVLFLPLLTYDENFQPVPNFARSWEVNADTTELTFHLRNDVYWHDGVKTTAEDVKFTYDLARNSETGFPNTAFWTSYGEAVAVDSFTFRVAMTPHAEFLDPWRSLAPVPKHVLEGVPAAEIRNHPFGTTRPVGNGPYKFVSRAQGQNWVFEANENFPEELGGRPYLDRIVYRSIPEPTTLLTELLTGGIDYYIAPTQSQAAQIESSPGVRLIHYPDRAFVILGWNGRRAPFDDVRVRRALTMALDREAMIEGIVYGYGSVANSTVPPFFWQADPEAGAELKYDPAASKRLLSEAGLVDRNGDGILEKRDGTPFRFTIKTVVGNQTRLDMAAKIQSDLRAVGVAVDIQGVEWGTLLDDINNPDTRNFDAVIVGWVTEFRIDDSDLFACDKMDEPYQWVSYCDPQTDSMLVALPRIVDREAAKPLWSRYQRKIAQDQPYTFLYFQERLEGVRDRLRGVDPDARGDWVGAKKWWIHPAQRAASGASAK